MIRINDDLKQHAPLGISILVGLMAFLTLIYIIRQWHGDWLITHQAIIENHSSTKNETVEMIASIPEAHVFGKNFSKAGMPITNLQLRVTGIVKTNSDSSKAYISMEGQPSKIYHVGDSLGSYGVKVYDITADSVILENDGHLEKLPLPREKLQFKPRDLEEASK